MWRSRYDMPPEQFDQVAERLWQQVKPLYDQLHCHTRAVLAKRYGEDKVPAGKPIPAHLLGNMWAQQWNKLYDDLVRTPGVLQVFHVAGGDDFLAHVAVEDAQALRDMVLQHITVHRVVQQTETQLVFELRDGVGVAGPQA